MSIFSQFLDEAAGEIDDEWHQSLERLLLDLESNTDKIARELRGPLRELLSSKRYGTIEKLAGIHVLIEPYGARH